VFYKTTVNVLCDDWLERFKTCRCLVFLNILL